MDVWLGVRSRESDDYVICVIYEEGTPRKCNMLIVNKNIKQIIQVFLMVKQSVCLCVFKCPYQDIWAR